MLRRLLFWVLLIAFGWILISRFGEIEKLATTLAQGRWPWVLVAIAMQILFFLTTAWVYQASFAVVGVVGRLSQLLPLTLAAVFVNSTAPSGGAGGIALFVDEAKRRGESPARTAAGMLLVNTADFGSFLLVLTVGLVILVLRHDLQSYELATAILMYLYVGSMVAILALGFWRPAWLRRVMQKLQSSINHVGGWVRHPTVLRPDWSEKNSAEFEASAKLIAAHPQQLLRTAAIGLLAHIVDIASLYTLFLAFNVTATLEVVIAGYAMTFLFWIISPTPNGIGVVEGLMPVVYTSLGLDTATATVITLTFRGLAFWLPFLIGFVLLRQLNMFGVQERSLARLGQVKLIAFLTAVMGLLNVLSASTPALAERAAILGRFSPLAVTWGGDITAVLAGFSLMILAYGLTQRKQIAWWLTLLVLALSMISHLLKGLDYEEATLAALLAGYLLWQRGHFQTRSDPPTVRLGLKILVAALAFTLFYGTLGFYLLDNHYSMNFDLWAAFRQTVVMFTQFYDPGLQPVTGFGHYFANSIYLIGAGTLLIGLFMLLRPVIVRQPATEAEWTRAREIVEKYGRSAIARFLLFPDKFYWFSSGGSMVGYAVRGKTAVALGDPVGPPEDAAAAIHGFRDYCHHQGWQPAFYQTLPDYLAHYKAAGFEAICTGHEAIVDLHTFSLAGKAGKPFRTASSHVSKLGYRAEIVTPPLSAALFQELQVVNDEWLTMMHGKEKQFSLGWFDETYLNSSPLIVVRDRDNGVVAFANILSEYSKNEVTVDLMRRRRETANGTMDYLFAELFQWCQEQGYDSFNLGLSSLAGVGEDPADPAMEKALHYVYDHVNQFYNFQGLHAFKEKFDPTWEPRYIIFPGATTLPAVWSTLAQVGTGDNFVLNYLRDLPPPLRQMARFVGEQVRVGGRP